MWFKTKPEQFMKEKSQLLRHVAFLYFSGCSKMNRSEKEELSGYFSNSRRNKFVFPSILCRMVSCPEPYSAFMPWGWGNITAPPPALPPCPLHHPATPPHTHTELLHSGAIQTLGREGAKKHTGFSVPLCSATASAHWNRLSSRNPSYASDFIKMYF